MQLRALRLARKLTQEELEAASGVDQGTISQIERDHDSNPTWSTLQKLAKALGCTEADIMAQSKESVAS